MNQFLKLSVVMAVLSVSNLCFAGTSMQSESKKNKNAGGALRIYAGQAKQGIYDFGSSNPKHIFIDLARRVLKSDLPIRKEERSTGGYSPYKATIVTLAKTENHLIELDMNSDLGFSAQIIVTSLLPNLSEVSMSIDSGAAASLSIEGPLAVALKETLVKLNGVETFKDVISLNGSTKTSYDPQDKEKTDIACGPLSRPDKEICLVYLN